MTVLPYVTVSIVSSLGRLDYGQARTLGFRVGAVVVGLWVVALSFAFLMPVAFPTVENASFFSTALVERRPPFDFVALYIPANPFNSLANNVVPAVVLFSVLLGVALIGVERKQALLDVLLRCGRGGVPRHAVGDEADPLRAVRDCRQRCRHAERGAVGPLADLLAELHRACAPGQSLGAPGAGGRLDAHSRARSAADHAECPDYRVCRRRSLHRPSRPDRWQQVAAAAPWCDAGCRGAAGRHRASVVQLSPQRKAPVDQLHPVCWMVRRCIGAPRRLSTARVLGPRHIFRQPQCCRAVSAGPVSDSVQTPFSCSSPPVSSTRGSARSWPPFTHSPLRFSARAPWSVSSDGTQAGCCAIS